MTDRADATIKALRSGYDELAALVRGFTADDLTRQSGAAKWDIAQVLSHLGSGAEISLANLEGALSGSGNAGGEFNQGVWARWDAMSKEDQAAGFLTANEALVSRYEGLDEETRSGLRVDLGFLPAPVDVAVAAGMRLNEFAHHAWDVKVAFDPQASLAPEATPLLFDQAAMFIGFLGKPAELTGRPLTIAVNTSSPERSFGVEVGEEKMTVGETPAGPDAVLTTPAEWWLRLVTGRHAPEHTPASVTLTGSITLDDLRGAFPGF